MRKILFILLLLIGLTSFADDVQFRASAPQIVKAGDQFSLTYTLNAKGSDLRMPNIDGFDILMGPSVSSSTSMQIINGNVTKSQNYSYTYILRASKVGKYTISPATIKVKKKIYQSNSLQIEAIQGRPQSNSAQQGNSKQQQGKAATQQSSADNLFIKYTTDKRTAYKGEMITATLKLYSRVALSVIDQTLPSFEGFWTQDIDIPSVDQTRTQKAVDGVIYNVYTLHKKILIPQQSGKLYIEPAEMVFNIQQRVRSNSVFDDFFGSVQNVRTNAKTKRIPITVKDLPAAPLGFNGAVGKFSLSSSIDKTSVTANEAITLKVSIKGNGNLKHINPFDFNFPPDFEIYDPKTSYNYKTSEQGMIGSTNFEQVLIPRFAGDFTIPAQKFVYFDTQRKTYKTLFTKQFDIHVERGADDQNTTVMSSLSKENVRFIGQDIRFIKQTDEKLKPVDKTFFGSIAFYLAYGISLLLFLLILVLERKRLRDNANAAHMRNKQASKIARKHLKNASICVKKNDKDEFFDALLKALWGYLSDKLTIPVSELSRENVRATLLDHNVNEETITEFIDLIDTCEMAKFAPSAVHDSIEDLYKKASKLIGKFEKQIRKKA